MLRRVNDMNKANGTGLVGYIRGRYQDLVELFGEPGPPLDDWKVDATWVFEDEQGRPVTIYNWKDGKNYMGEHGHPVEEITVWHVGGNGQYALEAVLEAGGFRVDA